MLWFTWIAWNNSEIYRLKHTRIRWWVIIRCGVLVEIVWPPPSILPPHAFLSFPHVDHLHPDWAIALAASANGEQKMQEFRSKIRAQHRWVPWQRPGFELALLIEKR